MRIALAVLLAGAAFGQTSQPAPVIGILNDIHAVNNLEKTLAFYRDVFSLSAEPRPFPNPGVPALTNSPGVSLRLAVLRLPNAGFGFELTEFSGIDRKPGQPRHTDPGAANLSLHVRDIDQVFAAVKKTGAPIITRSGALVTLGSPDRKIRSMLIRDPDGYVIEAIQLPPGPDAPATGNVIGASMGFTVADMESTLKFYRDLLGFELKGNMQFTSTRAILDMAGLPEGAEFREVSGTIPGTKAQISFYEFRGVPRTPFHLRIPDPGAPAMALRVRDLDGLLERMRAAGVKLVSAGGKVVQFSPTIRNIFIEDPNGVNLELYESKQ